MSITSSSVATPRAVLIGLALAITVNLFSLAGSYHVGYRNLTFGHIDFGLLIPFLIGVLGPNILVKFIRPSWGLRYPELLFVFCLGWIGFTVPAWGLLNYLVNIMVEAHYYVSPENQWRALFFPYLPDWVVISDGAGAVTGYYQGIRDAIPIPWGAWVIPVLWWFSFFAGLLAVGLCQVVLLRKQWVEHERLSYPLAQLPIALTETSGEDASPWPAMIRNRMFAIGFGLSLFMMLWNIAGYWLNWEPFPIRWGNGTSIQIGRDFPPQIIRMNVITFTLSFFMNVDILFSIWFFQILKTLEQGLLTRVGINSVSGTAIPGGLVAVQFIGGLIAFVIWGFWTARRHLSEVWRHIRGGPSSLRDEDELLPYRTAVMLGVFGSAYVVFWLHTTGMSFPVIVVFLLLIFLFYMAVCRVVAESGFVFVDLPVNVHQFTVAILGSGSLSPQNLLGLGLGSAFARNWKALPMVVPAHIARLKSVMRIEGRTLFLWCAVAFGISLLIALYFTVYSGYRLGGAANFYQRIYGDGRFYGLVGTWLKNSTHVTGTEIIFLLIGAATVMGITVARYLFPWWPLSPIGFVVAAGGTVRSAFLPIFLVWLLKVILLRAGGMKMYRSTQPLILGILIGHIVGAALSILADVLYFPDAFHEIQDY